MKLKALLTLAFASLCSWQGAWADRMAPELPAAQTLESGQSYYLYNVMEGKFVCRSTTSSQQAGLGTYGDKVTITATENEGEYTIQWASNNYYWRAYDSYITSSSGIYGSYDYFTIAESSKGYTIQRSPRNTGYYKADEFIGYDGSNGDRITPALAEGSIHWQMMSAADAEHYFAKHKLYTYLEQADQNNFYVTQYDLVYNNASSTTAQLNEAQLSLKAALDLSQNYVSPSWTEYPILFQSNEWVKHSNTGFSWGKYSTGTEQIATMTATINVDNDATLVYTYYANSWNINLRVYLDGELLQTISSNKSNYYYTSSNNSDKDYQRRYYVELTPGKHDIVWTSVCNDSETNNSNSCYLSDIGVQNTPTITPATTTVEGQLGTEVLKLVDPVSSVKKIVISGVIGADDWTTIGLMVNAFSIDMSQATAIAPLPASMFTKSKFPFLHYFTLPQGLTSIGNNAFEGSDIENAITFPASLTSIGSGAFSRTKISAAYMSDGITEIGGSAFANCRFLENVTYPATAGTIPSSCFVRCLNLRTFTIPEGITEISNSAFYACWPFNPRFPQSVKTIGYSAFYKTATDSLFVTDGMTVESEAFSYCDNLVYAEWPTTYANAEGNCIVKSCAKLNKVILKSPTVLKYSSQSFLSGNTLGNITLLVPDFLESAYKLDPYWYQCNVQSFNSADITDWQVSQPLTLNPGQRIGGTPNLSFWGSSNFTVMGDDNQAIGDMWVEFIPYRFQFYNGSWTEYKYLHYNFMLSNTNNVNITGKLSENIYTSEKKWFFLTLPFDTKVSDIVAVDFQTGAATSFAIRYYDGASRATGATSGNWKNYTKDDIIPAGTGFIYQTAKAARSQFVAQDNESKQYILSNTEFVKGLVANPSDAAANKGWNLVGNPWQTYYNIHKLNFTAPITVWDMSSSKYVAYSIIDDDYAIKPLEAIFVQCPDELSTISFPIDGRQLTDVIESQNAARAQQPAERKLIDIELSNGELSDKTRFVLNPQAAMGYELSCDASKFMSMDASVPQIYTIENGTQLAINERPLGEGMVQIGFKVAQDGTYTITSPRNQFQNIVLVDNETDTETLLTDGEGYTFTASAGSRDDRFMLRVGSIVVTGVQAVAAESQQAGQAFNLQGQRINAPQRGLYIVNGKKVIK
ncbi:MAG: leucine-rich repeat protein [Prevotella sp.]|nr:leucine-rich repeat protein [Prevotella sp.]